MGDEDGGLRDGRGDEVESSYSFGVETGVLREEKRRRGEGEGLGRGGKERGNGRDGGTTNFGERLHER